MVVKVAASRMAMPEMAADSVRGRLLMRGVAIALSGSERVDLPL